MLYISTTHLQNTSNLSFTSSLPLFSTSPPPLPHLSPSLPHLSTSPSLLHLLFHTQEKDHFLSELKNKEVELNTSREVQEKLMGRIHTMESKLLRGGKNIIDHTNEQQRALQLRTHELMDQKVSVGLGLVWFGLVWLG